MRGPLRLAAQGAGGPAPWPLQGHSSPTSWLSLAGPTARSIPPQPLHAAPVPRRTNSRGIFSLEKRHKIVE